MRPSDMTTGVKARPMPNFLNSTEMVPSCCATGSGTHRQQGNSPVSPEIAVKFGSAKVCSKPSCSRARRTVCTRFSPDNHWTPPPATPGLTPDGVPKPPGSAPPAELGMNGAIIPPPCVLIGKGSLLSAAKAKVAGVDQGAEVDAELLDDVALHLHHGDLEQHLLSALHGEHVDELTGRSRA